MKDDKKNGYAYTRQWFDFISETEENVTPMHTSLYTWIVELNNRLQWCDVVGLPTDRTMRMCRIKSYKWYKKTLDDLINWGFIKPIRKSRNQYTCNEVALVLNTKAVSKQIPKQLHHNKTIQTEETIKNNGDTPEKIFNLFKEVFNTYVVTDREKELQAGARLSEILKQTEINTEDALRKFFVDCSNISDNWIRTRITLPFIAGDFNRVQNAIAADKKKPASGGGKSRSGGGARDGKYRNSVWDNIPSGLKPGSSPDLKDVDTDNYLNEQ